MRPVRRSRGRSVRQNFRRKQFQRRDNGHSVNRVVTHPEGGARAAFSEQQLKSENQGRKAGRNNRSLALLDISMKAVKWELSAMMVPICV